MKDTADESKSFVSEKTILPGVRKSLKAIGEAEGLINSTIEKADLSSMENLRKLYKVLFDYSHMTLSFSLELKEGLLKLATTVAGSSSLNSPELNETLKKMNNEINSNTESIRKIQEILDNKFS